MSQKFIKGRFVKPLKTLSDRDLISIIYGGIVKSISIEQIKKEPSINYLLSKKKLTVKNCFFSNDDKKNWYFFDEMNVSLPEDSLELDFRFEKNIN